MGDDNDDRDSLFGSPPPSPSLRGRSPGIGLALPGTRTSNTAASVVDFENVGTTALFGLHPIFDLPASSEVSSVSSVTPGWPPAQNALSKRSRTVTSDGQTPPPQQSARKAVERPPRRLAEPLDLPEHVDTSANPHLLRSHPSLLGKAGSVAGVKLGRLPCPGSSANDPIVIEDEARHREPAKRFQPRFIAPLPTPKSCASTSSPTPVTAKEIMAKAAAKRVATTIKKNPEFQRILQDLNAVATFIHHPPPLQDASDSNRPTKKRKTHRGQVPEGARYWTVPFPISEGKASEEYTQEWKKTNIKRLLADLINLVNATHKKVIGDKPRERALALPNTSLERCKASSTAPSTPQQEVLALPQLTAPPPLQQQQPNDAVLDPMLDSSAFASAVGLDGLFKILKDFETPPPPAHYPTLDLEPAGFFPPATTDLQAELFPVMFDQLYDGHTNPPSLQITADDLAFTDWDNIVANLDFGNFEFDTSSTTGTEETEYATMATRSPLSSYDSLPTPMEYTPADSPIVFPPTEHNPFPQFQLDLLQIAGETSAIDLGSPAPAPYGFSMQLPAQTCPPPTVQASHESVQQPSPPPVGSLVSRKHEALAKAKALQEQLLEQINQAKMELWEYTIESGVIGNIQLIT